MKIRNRHLISTIGWCGTRMVRALSGTLRFDYRSVGPVAVDPKSARNQYSFIYALWHENFLIPITRFGNSSVAALVSRHADGQILGTLIRATGMGVIYGSSNRGGVAAVRQILRSNGEYRHLAVTPDGPRGPRRIIQPGMIYLASRTGLRIVPLGVGHSRPWRVNSWDAFAVPRPFSRVRCLFGEPLTIPPDLRPAELESHGGRVQLELDRMTEAAQQWAETGRLQLPPTILQARIGVSPIQQSPPPNEVGAGAVSESGE
jgi:lysophospholipid acyltransferase (LPLAT)-like uncharacterized protein